MFADDSNLFSSGSNLLDMTNQINSEIPLLIDWLRANRLSLNTNKTHVMIFGPKNKPNFDTVDIKIGDTPLEIVNTTKFLGVILDNNLNWKQHITHISKKIAKSIGIISIAKKTLNQKTLLQLYFSFLYPYLTYCVLIWGNSPNTTLWPVYRLQKLAIRLVANIKRRDSSLSYCKTNQILRLPDIYTFNVGIFMYKFKNSLLPTTFDRFYTTNQEHHRYPTRSATHLRPPLVKTKLGENFITKAGVTIWNEICANIDVNTKIGTFKSRLKKNLTKKY
jgi:hypothetical protein